MLRLQLMKNGELRMENEELRKILNERKKWFEWKNIKPIFNKINEWKMENEKWKIKDIKLDDTIEIDVDNIDMKETLEKRTFQNKRSVYRQ